MLRLSQRHLKILETCPRQFEHTYFDRLALPVPATQQVKTRLGSEFHLLMQQRELGLPITPILEQHPKLAEWMTAMSQTAPELFELDTPTLRASEELRTLEVGNYLFTVIFDLLLLKPDQANIIDWKTYPLPKYKKDLDLEWQTRLYLYVLAETSDYLPKQIDFTYWFIQSTPKPKSVRITYTPKQHRKTQEDLAQLLNKLTDWLDGYRVKGEPFPQIPASEGSCQYCNFAPRCGREQLLEPSQDSNLSSIGLLEQIPLVSI